MSQNLAGTVSQAPVVGEPAETPARTDDKWAYPAVHDMPPPRNSVVLTAIEQRKFEDDLLAARDRQQQAAGTAPAGARKPGTRKEAGRAPKQQSRTEPGYIAPTSSRSIY